MTERGHRAIQLACIGKIKPRQLLPLPSKSASPPSYVAGLAQQAILWKLRTFGLPCFCVKVNYAALTNAVVHQLEWTLEDLSLTGMVQLQKRAVSRGFVRR